MAMEKFASKLAPEKIRILSFFNQVAVTLIHICNRHLPNVKSKAPVSDGHGNVFQGIVSENKAKRMKMKWRNKQKTIAFW